MKMSMEESLRQGADAYKLIRDLVPQIYIDVMHRSSSEMRNFVNLREGAQAAWTTTIRRQNIRNRLAIIDTLEAIDFALPDGTTAWVGCIAHLRVIPGEPLDRRTVCATARATTANALTAFTAWVNGDPDAIKIIGATK